MFFQYFSPFFAPYAMKNSVRPERFPKGLYGFAMQTSFRNKKRDAGLTALSEILEYGSEEPYMELLVGWSVPTVELNGLLNEFRGRRQEKRGLLR